MFHLYFEYLYVGSSYILLLFTDLKLCLENCHFATDFYEVLPMLHYSAHRAIIRISNCSIIQNIMSFENTNINNGGCLPENLSK